MRIITRKTFVTILLRTMAVVMTIILVVVGISAYNHHYYRRHGDNPYDSSIIAAKGGVEPVTGAYLRGFYYPAHGVTHPGTVVVFKGSDGSNNDELARQIRDQGYNVLGLYFFGQPGQQQRLVNVPLEFFDEVLAWIRAHGTASEPITVVGVSKGAELVANLAVHYPEINNIVLYTPTVYNFQGLDYQRDSSPSFRWQGQPIDYVRIQFQPSNTIRLALNLPVSYRETYERSLAAATNLEIARIPIEKFSGQGLLFAGDQDAMWPGDTAVRELAERNPHLKGVVYRDAGHLFDQDITHYGPMWSTTIGGTVAGNREAKIQSDKLLFERLHTWHEAHKTP